jgi:hypothetical protein
MIRKILVNITKKCYVQKLASDSHASWTLLERGRASSSAGAEAEAAELAAHWIDSQPCVSELSSQLSWAMPVDWPGEYLAPSRQA